MPLPPEPDLEVLHTRTYDVKAHRKDADTLLLRGIVRDEKPGGTYITDDPEPLTVHHMVVDLEVAYPSTEIVGINVIFEDHPQVGPTGQRSASHQSAIWAAKRFAYRMLKSSASSGSGVASVGTKRDAPAIGSTHSRCMASMIAPSIGLAVSW